MTNIRPIKIREALTAVDAFCGAGGLSLGLNKAGFNISFAFDSNERAIKTYRRNLGNHANVLDAKSVGRELLDNYEGVTLFAGGPPCQGFSVQRRGSANDARNDLVFEFIRIVSDLRPKIFLMENVAALASPRNALHFNKIVEMAEVAGYSIEAKILNAADFGVAQVRKRLFILGTRKDFSKPLSLPDGKYQQATWKTVEDAIGGLPEPRSELGKTIPNHVPDNISELNRERISHVPPGGGRSDIPVHLRLPCHSVSVETAGHRGVYGRLDWDKPSGTITTKCNSFTRGRFAHPVENRNISMREAARIQSFPDDFVFEGGTVDVAHQVGNAVPPTLAYEIGVHLINQINAIENEFIDINLLSPAVSN